MSGCSHNCESCSENCASRNNAEDSLSFPQNSYSHIKKVIGVVSGKGGVGKSLVTSLLASAVRHRGYNTAILDADITGPSIPKAFGLKEKAKGTELGIMPVISKSGIEIMSLNLLIDDDTEPVVWRGPVIAGVVKQFWQDIIWNDVDYMFVDMPPGTGDVPLTVFQSLPVDGIIVVTSPQELVGMIVEKAVKMAEMMNIPILALVENMSYFECPDCGKIHHPFGESHITDIADKYGIKAISEIPIDPAITKQCDKGNVEDCEGKWLDEIIEMLIEKFKE